MSGVNSDWLTPPDIIERARRVIGTIDLDPASCEVANRAVGALRWFGPERDGLAWQDGLACTWSGSVWVNPPSPCLPWWAKLIEERRRIRHALFLAYNA